MRKIFLDTAQRVSLRRILLYAVLFIAACAPCRLPAQAIGTAPSNPTFVTVKKVGDTAQINWTTPSLWSDGSALGSVPLTYTLYSAAPGAPWTVRFAAGAALTHTTNPLTKGPLCFTTTSTAGGLESTASGAVCINVGVPPNPPAAISVK